MKIKNREMGVKCHCGAEVDLLEAPWCGHKRIKTKLCPNGHCICHKLDKKEQWRPATEEERKFGFEMMLKEEYGGIKQ